MSTIGGAATRQKRIWDKCSAAHYGRGGVPHLGDANRSHARPPNARPRCSTDRRIQIRPVNAWVAG
eukprot:5096969-Prymnesium_polylepis.2